MNEQFSNACLLSGKTNLGVYQGQSIWAGAGQSAWGSLHEFNTRLGDAILRTVAYGDAFDYPLTAREIFRYLIGMRVSPRVVVQMLAEDQRLGNCLSAQGDYICLRGREHLMGLRRRRSARAKELWPGARLYGRLINSLPFVRMIAVTGSLAVNNPGEGHDIDYLIVASHGRVWLCRSMAIAVVHWAARRGDHLCPNYVLSERSLWSERKDLYTAHELAQLVPLSGIEIYNRMRFANLWMSAWLPNAYGPPPTSRKLGNHAEPGRLKKVGEACLSGTGGDKLEKWEMDRKIKKFSRQAGQNEEAEFTSAWCKGHFEGHASHTMEAYQDRLEQLDLDWTGDKL